LMPSMRGPQSDDCGQKPKDIAIGRKLCGGIALADMFDHRAHQRKQHQGQNEQGYSLPSLAGLGVGIRCQLCDAVSLSKEQSLKCLRAPRAEKKKAPTLGGQFR